MGNGASLADGGAGGYRYLPGVFQYSAGVAAEPGFEIERARLLHLPPLAEGFAAIRAHIEALGRPLTALCACELRSPAPFSEEGFRAFNLVYVGTLAQWGIYREGNNPVARSNVCPEIGPPASPSLYAFSYTVRAEAPARPSFVIAGSGEAPEGRSSYRDHIVARGDVSPAGVVAKARWVLGEMERRMAALGVGWADATATQLYTVHDIHPFLGDELARRGAIPAGLTWHFCRPPIVDLDYEMDVRGLRRELTL
jgi:hypothetical protein